MKYLTEPLKKLQPLQLIYNEAQKSQKLDMDYAKIKKLVKSIKLYISFVIYHTKYSINTVPSNNLEDVK